MIILGLDPGSRITGYGIIKKYGDKITHLDNGPIHCGKANTFNERLSIIYHDVQNLIQKFNPEAVVIEKIFHAKNASSALKLGQARGSAIVAATNLNIPTFEYSALQVKQAVTGYGRASKDQVQQMIKTLLKLPEIAEENSADALAIALCHAQSYGLNRLMEMAKK